MRSISQHRGSRVAVVTNTQIKLVATIYQTTKMCKIVTEQMDKFYANSTRFKDCRCPHQGAQGTLKRMSGK